MQKLCYTLEICSNNQQPTTNNQQPTTNQFRFRNLLIPAILGLTLSLGGCTSSGGSENSSSSGSSEQSISSEIDLSKAEAWIRARNPNSPLSANDFYDTAQKYGIDFEILLAQAQQEGSFAKNPNSKPHYTKNIFNIGNTDSGATITYASWQEGLDAYGKLVAQMYPGGKNLLNNFVNRDGKRYASDPNYENKLRQIIASMNFSSSYSQPLAVSQSPVTTKPAKRKVEEKTSSIKTFLMPTNGKCGQGYWSNDQTTCKPI